MSCDVAVIGAGLAGLAAADALCAKGIDAQIFELQAKAGGRVYTHRLASGEHFEEGAFGFMNLESTMMEIVGRFSLELGENYQPHARFFFQSRLGKFTDSADFLGVPNVTLNQLLEHFLSQVELTDQMSITEALKKAGATDKAIKWIRENSIIGLQGDSFDDLSSLTIRQVLSRIRGASKVYTIKGGNDRLTDALANELRGHIHFNFKVTKIRRTAEGVIIEGPEQIKAKRLIFAVPLQALREINPELSDEKRHAIKRVPYTSCSRVSFVGPPGMFEEVRGGVFGISDSLSGWYRDQTAFQKESGKGTVFNVSIVGQEARRFKELDQENRTAEIVAGLKHFYPSVDGSKFQSHFFSWDDVPWIKGGYCHYPPGTFHLREELAKPEGVFHFAGEHTAERYASMGGAIDSGVRAAKEVIEAFGV